MGLQRLCEHLAHACGRGAVREEHLSPPASTSHRTWAHRPLPGTTNLGARAHAGARPRGWVSCPVIPGSGSAGPPALPAPGRRGLWHLKRPGAATDEDQLPTPHPPPPCLRETAPELEPGKHPEPAPVPAPDGVMVPSGRSLGGVLLLQPHFRTWDKATSLAATASRNPILPRKKPSGLSSDEAPWRAGPTGRPSDRLAWSPVGIRCLRVEREPEHQAGLRSAPPKSHSDSGGSLLTCGPVPPRSPPSRR